MAFNDAAALPDLVFLKECFFYDEFSGALTWKVRPLHHFKNIHGMNTFNSKFSGRIAGSVMEKGYLTVSVSGNRFLVHRVVWKLVTGIEPPKHIDHRDLNKANNKFQNLRQATKSQNGFNRNPSVSNSTGFKGVSWDSSREKFYSSIFANGKTVSLGRHTTAEQAYAAYCKAAKEIHGEFANL